MWIVHETLLAKGFEFVRPPAVYRGPLPVHGKRALVEINIPDVSFARRPVVRLLDSSELPVKRLAHLIGDSAICYAGAGGLPLDYYDPGGSILRVLIEAAVALERSFGGKASEEFERELSSYWEGKWLLFAVPRKPEPAIIYADAIDHTDEDATGVVVVPRGEWKERDSRGRAASTILNFSGDLRHPSVFPFPNMSTAVAYIGAQARPPAGWRKAVLAATAAEEYLFLAGPNAIFGWRARLPGPLEVIRARKNGFRPDFFAKALERSLDKTELHRVTGHEADLEFCVRRNLGGDAGLVGKRVALVGCGTIGGYLGRMLVQSGAGCGAQLRLYDTDTLSPGNLGRHLLGFDDIGKNKADALAANLKAFHPDVNVKSFGLDATKEWPELEKADLIIDATGDLNVATILNELFLKSAQTGDNLALLHTWVFGNGVSGQSFLNLKDGGVCFRCLKTGFDGKWRYNPLKDPSSPLQEAPARCGEGAYVPFAVDASVAAAGLALRAALDWAQGKPGHRLRTVIVDHEAGRDKVPWVSPNPLSNCSACGSQTS